MITGGKYFIISTSDVSAPQRAMNPPTIQLMKNTLGVMAALAESEAVLKIPMPITNPMTIMVRSKRLSWGFLDGVMH